MITVTLVVVTTARLEGGVERLDQIKHSVLERSGAISIIAADGDGDM